jgi:hypothetical protein
MNVLTLQAPHLGVRRQPRHRSILLPASALPPLPKDASAARKSQRHSAVIIQCLLRNMEGVLRVLP